MLSSLAASVYVPSTILDKNAHCSPIVPSHPLVLAHHSIFYPLRCLRHRCAKAHLQSQLLSIECPRGRKQSWDERRGPSLNVFVAVGGEDGRGGSRDLSD